MKVQIAAVIALSALAFSSCKSPAPPSVAQDSASASMEDENAVIAKVYGQNITNKDLSKLVGAALVKLDNDHAQQRYELRRRALDQIVTEKIIEPKAKAAGKSVNDFMKAEFIDKAPNPSDAEVQKAYDDSVKSGQKLQPLAEIKPRIVEFLKQQKASAPAQAFLEKLKDEAKVEILLPAPNQKMPPRNENVEAKGFSRGAANAPITIVEFSDYECPFCSAAERTINEILKTYEGKVRLFYRDFPLNGHPNARKASEAAHCAADQDKFWEMHAKLFENQRALEVDSLKSYAKGLGLDTVKFNKCLDSGEKAAAIEAHFQAGAAIGVESTPAFFINGLLVSGAQPLEVFKGIIDSELARSQPKK